MRCLLTKMTLFFLVFSAFQSVSGQENPQPSLVDSFAYSNSEGASARIDNWRIALSSSPQNKGLAIIYGGQISKRGEIEAHVRGIKQTLKTKGTDEKAFTIRKGGFRKKLTIEFWIVPEGANPPTPSPTVSPKSIRFRGVSPRTIPYDCCF